MNSFIIIFISEIYVSVAVAMGGRNRNLGFGLKRAVLHFNIFNTIFYFISFIHKINIYRSIHCYRFIVFIFVCFFSLPLSLSEAQNTDLPVLLQPNIFFLFVSIPMNRTILSLYQSGATKIYLSLSSNGTTFLLLSCKICL